VTVAASPPSEARLLRLRLGAAAFPLTSDKVVVGRSRSCDIRLKEDTVSRLHAVLLWQGEALMLEDLGSSNGTFVNGERVLTPHQLLAGDVVRFGALRGSIERSDAPLPHPDTLIQAEGFDYTAGLVHGEAATLGWRLLAFLTDLVLFTAGSVISLAPFLVMLIVERFLLAPEALPPSSQTKSLVAGGGAALWALFAWYYVVHGWARRGGTLGMRLCGLRLLDWRRHTPIGYRRALLRLLTGALSVLTLGGGFLLIALRRDRKALHDVLAGTIVAHQRPRLGRAAGPA
jgi:uncharacterized RDD family membrane protein YckC